MEYTENYELFLNHISAGESMLMDDLRYEKYSHSAALWLSHQGIHLFQDEIMAKYNTDKTFKEILEQRKHQYLPGIIVQRGNKREQVYYDVWGVNTIEVEDSFFPFFFACKFSHIDILDIDEFLNYHLEKSFENNKDKYFRFLTLVFRRYEYLLKPQTSETAKEWITAIGKENELSGTQEKDIKIKGRIQREAGDKLTSLSLAQTAALIQFMQESRIILKGHDLTFTQAGKAFSILTGYSSHTLRQQLGSKGDIIGVKNEDYKELHEVILKLASLVESKIHKK